MGERDYTLVIEPGDSELHYWKDVWRYRELFWFLSWRDILVRYKQTAIGIAWSVIRPLLVMIVFTLVFGKLAGLRAVGAPYPVMVFAAMLPWQFFSNALTESSNALVANSNLLTKVYFPRLIIPASAVIVSLVDVLISLVLLAGIMLWYGVVPDWHVITLPLFLVLAFIVSFGIGLWFAALNVKYRDFRYIVPFIVTFGVYVSPVGFSSSVVPENWRLLYSLNPMVGVIDGFRWGILGGTTELYWPGFWVSTALAVLVLALAVRHFRSSEQTFADVVWESSVPIITVENLGKKYTLRHEQREAYSTLRDVMAAKAKAFAGRIVHPFGGRANGRSAEREEFWALKDVAFEIQQGDRVGIIGRNGAGKSTLLKILSRITKPTTGRIVMHGRVASLLEVGTGFHPELSGRENVMLNGAILGMSRAEILRKFDEIVAFAEVEKFLDTPVKHYSSGMYVRLAFAVAAHLEPEILVVDEVLAVGDAQFQKKCLGKMEDVSAKEGRTVLFVSHNMQAIGQLCQRAILLHGGAVAANCDAQTAIAQYMKAGSEPAGRTVQQIIDDLPQDPTFRLQKIELRQAELGVVDTAENARPIDIEVHYEVRQKATGLRVYLDVCDDSDVILFRSFHDEDNDGIPTTEPGRYVSTVAIPGNLLGPTRYVLRINASIFNERHCLPDDGVCIPLDVAPTGAYNRAYLGDTFRGKLAPILPWTTRRAG